MATWKIYAVDPQNTLAVASDGLTMDQHGNVIFVDVLSENPQRTEIVAVLFKGGIVAKREGN